MKIAKFLTLLVFAMLESGFVDGVGGVEKCSIKDELACSGPLNPWDKSYTYSLGTELDSEQLLKKQLAIYRDLRKRLKDQEDFPVSVMIKSKKTYDEIINESFVSFLNKPESAKVQYLKKLFQNPHTFLLNVSALPDIEQALIFQNVPLSRFKIPNEAYTEKTLKELKHAFPEKIQTEEALSESQKTLLAKYGALAVLAAQGVLKKVRLKLKN